MPNTPCKHSPSRNTQVPRSIPTPDSSNEVLNKQLQSELELRREGGLANHTPETAQSSPVRSRKEKVGRETRVAGLRERRQGTRWMSTLVPFFSPNASGIKIRRSALYHDLARSKGMVGSTAAAGGGLNYGVGPSVMQIELARTKCSKCMITFLRGRRSVRLRWGTPSPY